MNVDPPDTTHYRMASILLGYDDPVENRALLMFFNSLQRRREAIEHAVTDKFTVEAQHQLNWLKKSLASIDPSHAIYQERLREIHACEAFLRTAAHGLASKA